VIVRTTRGIGSPLWKSSRIRPVRSANHTSPVDDLDVFGVPTFIANGEAVFARIMDRHNITDVTRVIDTLEWTT
jgi:hypothetical protein